MSYHGSPKDSLANAIARAKERANRDIEVKSRPQRIKKRVLNKDAYEAAKAFNIEHGLIPVKSRLGRFALKSKAKKVTLPAISMPFAPDGD